MAKRLHQYYLTQGQRPRKDSVDTRARLLVALLTNPRQQAAELATAIGGGKSTIERHLATLKQEDLIEIQGTGKSRFYQPTEQTRKLSAEDVVS